MLMCEWSETRTCSSKDTGESLSAEGRAVRSLALVSEILNVV